MFTIFACCYTVLSFGACALREALKPPATAAVPPAVERCAAPPCNIGLGDSGNVGEYGVLVGSTNEAFTITPTWEWEIQPPAEDDLAFVVANDAGTSPWMIVGIDRAGRVKLGDGVKLDEAARRFWAAVEVEAGRTEDRRVQAEKLLAMANAKLEVAERLTKQTVNSYVCPPGHRSDRSDCIVLRPGETLVRGVLTSCSTTTNAVPLIQPGDYYRGPLEDQVLDLVHKP
jgi:hypothetical protein